MPGETPDYGRLSAQATVYPVTDLGELAGRLGSPITHDRRGDVLWFDDFEWGLNKWQTEPFGTGAAAALSTDTARNGRASVLLTAGSDGGLAVRLIHHHAPAVESPLGAEFSFSHGTQFDALELLIQAYRGAELVRFGLQYRAQDDALQYRDSDGIYTTYRTGVNLAAYREAFNTLKLVFEPATHRYVRAILNQYTDDLSAYAGQVVLSPTSPLLQVRIALYGRAGGNDRCYLDDVILTQNEPL